MTIAVATDHRTYANRRELLTRLLFGVFLSFVLIGVQPFWSSANEWAPPAGEGNLLRQVMYGFLFVAVVGLQVTSAKPNLLRPIPMSCVVLLSWMLLSVLWSASPELTARRSVLVVLVTAMTFVFVDLLGPKQALRILSLVMAAIIIVDLVSVYVVPGALQWHEGKYVWIGMHGHKNVAGAVAAFAGLLFLHQAMTSSRRVVPLLLLVLSAVFLLGTESKTAIALFAALTVCLIGYDWASRSQSGRRLFQTVAVVSLCAFVGLIFLLGDELMAMLEDPRIFTGRGAIWQVVLSYLPGHLWEGAGFGAFWEGDGSPARAFIDELWILRVGHAHNSYLDLLASIGLVGLCFALVALVWFPLSNLLRFSVMAPYGGLVLAWILFGVVGNMTKSQFLDRDRPEWVLFVIAVAIVHQSLLQGWQPAAGQVNKAPK